MAIFYKGEDVILTFQSTEDMSGFTKAVKFFTPYATPKAATVVGVNNNVFTAKLASADTASLPTGTLNIVLEFTSSSGKIITKTVRAKLADPYLDGGDRGSSAEISFIEISFIEGQVINISFTTHSVVAQEILDQAAASAAAAAASAEQAANVLSRLPVVVEGKATEIMTKGTPVYVSNSNGSNPLLSKASNATEAKSSKVVGLLAQNLAVNGQGIAIKEGILDNIGTGTAIAGDPVWLGDGVVIYGLLNKPKAPLHLVFLGIVIRPHATNGAILVSVQNGFELEELHNVKITNPLNGQVLIYNSEIGLWENKIANLQEQNNPDISFAIVDAQNKILAYFDLLGKLFADVNLSANNVSTLSIADNAVTKQKLESSLQSLLTLLSGTQSVSDIQADGYIITDSNNKKVLEIGLDGKIKGLFDFSLSPIQVSDLSSNIVSLIHQTYTFNQDFQEFCYAITDSLGKVLFGIKPDGKMSFETFYTVDFNPDFQEYVFYIMDTVGKVIFGIRQDGTTTAPAILEQSSVGLNELKQEVISRLQPAKQIVFWGDSLTAGAGGNGTSTPSVMQTLMPDYTVVNAGVGGETVASISARQGGMPCLITAGFTLPANTSTVEISSNANHRLRNALGTIITPLLQGDGNSVNPCYVEGIECTLSWTGTAWNDPAGLYLIRRNVAGEARAIKANSPLIFKGAKAYRDANIVVIEIGQNGGYSTTEEYLEYVESIIRYSRNSNFIVVGNHTGTPASRAELEAACLRKFGSRYINMREYISGNAMYDLGLTPTTQDLTAMTNGTFPPSLWASPTDSTHGNASFYTAKAKKIYSRFLELGYK